MEISPTGICFRDARDGISTLVARVARKTRLAMGCLVEDVMHEAAVSVGICSGDIYI